MDAAREVGRDRWRVCFEAWRGPFPPRTVNVGELLSRADLRG